MYLHRDFAHVVLSKTAAAARVLYTLTRRARALPPSGDEWKTVGVFEDLDRLWALWEDGEETHVLS